MANTPGSNNDDLFSPLPPVNDGNMSNTAPNAPYTPPPYNPNQPRKGPNPVLMIILGVILGITCLCGVCLLLFGGTIASVFNNPTFQAAVSTAKIEFGTLGAMVDVPDTLPSDATDQGAIRAGESKQVSNNVGSLVWSYNGSSSEQITITADTGGKGLAIVGLYGPDNKLIKKAGLALSGTGVSATTLTQTLTTTGTFHILVGGASNQLTLKVDSTAR